MEGYQLGLYEKAMPEFLSFREKLKLAKYCGYDFVEMSIDETEEKISRLDMSREMRRELCEMRLECGIGFESICLSAHRKYSLGSSNFWVRSRGLDIMEKAIVLAADLGIRMIQIAGYDVYYEEGNAESRKRFEDNLEHSVEYASRYGVLLAFETMETKFMDTVEKAKDWVDKMHSPYLCIYPDSGNITNAAKIYQTDVIEDLRKGIGNIVAIHLKESRPGQYREIPYGKGSVKFKEIIEQGLSMGVKRYLAEFWYVGGENYRKELAEANSFLRSHFEKCESEK